MNILRAAGYASAVISMFHVCSVFGTLDMLTGDADHYWNGLLVAGGTRLRPVSH
jgi:hypothetical protein